MSCKMEILPPTTDDLLSEACVGLEGTSDNLEKMLKEFPQKSKRGSPNYLLAGGWAVELLTGNQREHEDIDVICIDEEYLSIFNTSVGSSRTNDQRAAIYYAMNFGKIPTASIRRNYTQEIEWVNSDQLVVIPSTEFLLLSKILGPLREKDLYDVVAILKTQDINPKKLANIIRKSGLDKPNEHASQIYSLSRNLKKPETSSQAFEELANYKGIKYC